MKVQIFDEVEISSAGSNGVITRSKPQMEIRIQIDATEYNSPIFIEVLELLIKHKFVAKDFKIDIE